MNRRIITTTVGLTVFTFVLMGCNGNGQTTPDQDSVGAGGQGSDFELGLPGWQPQDSHAECMADGSDTVDQNPPPLLVAEWVRNTDGVVYGEIVRVEPILDRFTRADTNALDTSGDCQDPEWQNRVYADLLIRPEVAAGAADGLDEVRLRITGVTQTEWVMRHVYENGMMRPQQGTEYGLAPGMMIGVRLHDLGLDFPEPVFSALSTSLFTFNDDDRLEFQYGPEPNRHRKPCQRWGEPDFVRSIDDVRPGTTFAEFSALLSTVSPADFGIVARHPGDTERASANFNMLHALDPDEREANVNRASLYRLLTSSRCNPPDWERVPPHDPDEFQESDGDSDGE